MKDEEWRKVEGFPHHLISNYGKVRSVRHIRVDKTGKSHAIPDRVLKGSIDKDGYLRYNLRYFTHKKIFLAHRLVIKTFVGSSTKRTVNHIDCNKLNNHVSNLEWATDKENCIHAAAHGLTSSKVTKKEVREIRKLKEGDKTIFKVAEDYGLSIAQVSRIWNRKRWEWLDD